MFSLTTTTGSICGEFSSERRYDAEWFFTTYPPEHFGLRDDGREGYTSLSPEGDELAAALITYYGEITRINDELAAAEASDAAEDFLDLREQRREEYRQAVAAAGERLLGTTHA